MEYTTLTPEQQEAMKQDRIAQFEREHFNHELNKTVANLLPTKAQKDEAVKNANDAQEVLGKAIAALKAATPGSGK